MTVLGVSLLGITIAYAAFKSRQGMTGEKRRLTERGTRDVYAAEQRDPANRRA
ncbi:hypothetical protein [Chenggangzhangella methanolivorans]|uniref:Uncharacterized protein n=2 Tax=Chenggangzhangella methanolivorans TaxID=1437009 RepID=A0A9E6RGN3_9HYPH|nr:hypothetical protein [Chenggangzhangella methanolivorans]QZO01101.1 hypothetical protein K6K41_05875 [Chenggangzhangella methanolivorans]